MQDPTPAELPKLEPALRTIAMPADANPRGDIFGGWLVAQMDLGSGILAAKTAKSRVVTVAIEAMAFLQPVRVGDTVAYWWTKDPTLGTPVFGGIDQLDDFAAKDLLVGIAASAA